MALIRFPYVNEVWGDAVTITGSSEALLRPASYLSNVQRRKRWRSETGVGAQSVHLDFGSAKTLACALLADFGGFGGGSIVFETSPNNVDWAPRGTFPAAKYHGVSAVWFADVSVRYARVLFQNPAAVSAYAEAGIVWTGAYYEPSYNLLDGYEWIPVDPSEVVESQDGQEDVQARTGYDRFECEFEVMPEDDFEAFRALWATVGKREPLFIAADPDDMAEVAYCKLESIRFPHVQMDEWNIPVRAKELR
jgi:hypothetical protein